MNQLTRSVENLSTDVRHLASEVEELRTQRALTMWMLGFLMVVTVLAGDLLINWWF